MLHGFTVDRILTCKAKGLSGNTKYVSFPYLIYTLVYYNIDIGHMRAQRGEKFGPGRPDRPTLPRVARREIWVGTSRPTDPCAPQLL